MITSSIVAVVLSFAAFTGIGLAFAFGTFTLCAYIISRFIPRLKLLKNTKAENFNPAPLYLTFIPAVVLLFQVTLAAPAEKFSRNYAIAKSAELIKDIEEYHGVYGRYPSSLLAVRKDYHPSVVGIEQFHYAPDGDAYNLYFEQPPLLFHNFGATEIVMYNRLGEHVMTSHAAWVLMGPPDELERRQGWYAVHNASSPHWKYFWFD